jgi:hypothetical protein
VILQRYSRYIAWWRSAGEFLRISSRTEADATDRLNEEKLETLRKWGDGLCGDARDEVRAAGRAIQLLIEEIEHLHVDLWHARAQAPAEAPEETPLRPTPETALRARLRTLVRRSESQP